MFKRNVDIVLSINLSLKLLKGVNSSELLNAFVDSKINAVLSTGKYIRPYISGQAK